VLRRSLHERDSPDYLPPGLTMSSSRSSSRNSFLLGVALVVNRSRDGPAFVFHYPPHVRPSNSNDADGSADGRLDPHDSLDLGDILLERLSQPAHRDFASSTSGGDTSRSQAHGYHFNDDHVVTESGSQIVPWEHVAGYPARDLAGILTPARSYHKKLFQIFLDPLCCVSCPMHVPENGRWKKPKKAGKAKSSKSADDQHLAPADAEVVAAKVEEAAKDGEGPEKDKEKEKEKEKDAVDEEKRSSMTMFNLVFILDPNHSGFKEWISVLYSNIIKKINRAYKYSQQHSEFVWKESKRILAAKDKGREEREHTDHFMVYRIICDKLLTSSRLEFRPEDE
jgi:hypothetical protein